jgi:hypothetical protein
MLPLQRIDIFASNNKGLPLAARTTRTRETLLCSRLARGESYELTRETERCAQEIQPRHKQPGAGIRTALQETNGRAMAGGQHPPPAGR